MGAYEGEDGPAIFRASKAKTNGFKKGGKADKADKAHGGCMK